MPDQTIKTIWDTVAVSVFNMMGQLVMTQNVDTEDVMIDMSAFENGMYMVSIMTDKGNIVKMINVVR